MSKVIEINGPFGNYVWGDPGAVLNAAVRQENVPLSKVENLIIKEQKPGELGGLYCGTDIVCRYKWVKGISTPLFMWIGKGFRIYDQHKFICIEDGLLKPQFRPSLCVLGTPAFQVSGSQATPDLYQFLCGMMTNHKDDPRYTLHNNAGAFFQSGSHDPECGFFMIEFWKPAGAEAFIQYMNENYVQKAIY